MDFIDRWKRSRGVIANDDGPTSRSQFRRLEIQKRNRLGVREDTASEADRGDEVLGKPTRTDVERLTKRIYAANYRNKHKERINAQRRLLEQEPEGAFKKARRKALYKKIPWELSYENWWNVWASCPKVYDEERGTYRQAWAMRSHDIQRGTQMRRVDTDKGWMVSNVHIVYRNQPIPAHGIVAPWDFRNDRPQYTVGEDGEIERHNNG